MRGKVPTVMIDDRTSAREAADALRRMVFTAARGWNRTVHVSQGGRDLLVTALLDLAKESNPKSYGGIGELLLTEAGKPMASSELIPAIAARRGIDAIEKRMVISSALSRDERIRNISWQGARAWWLADRAIPKESAGPSGSP